MPAVRIDGVGDVQFPDTMSTNDIAKEAASIQETFAAKEVKRAERHTALAKELAQEEKRGARTAAKANILGWADFILRPFASTPENPLGGLGAGRGGAMEPVGKAINYAGNVGAAAARDIRLGQVTGTSPFPATSRALSGTKLPPAGTPVARGLEGLGRTLPLIAAGGGTGAALKAAGARAAATPAGFGLPMYWSTHEATDDIGEAVTAGVTGAAIPGVMAVGRAQAANVLSKAVERGLMSPGATMSQKIAEQIAGLGAIEAFMTGMDLPGYIAMEPDERRAAIYERLIQTAGFGAMGLGRVFKRVPSETQAKLGPERLKQATVADAMNRLVKDKGSLEILRNAADEYARRQAGTVRATPLGTELKLGSGVPYFEWSSKNLKGTGEALRLARQQIGARLERHKPGGTREQLKAWHNAVDNKAALHARQVRRDIEHFASKHGKLTKRDGEALTFYIEAGGSLKQLKADMSLIKSKGRRMTMKYGPILKHAIRNHERFRPIAAMYNKWTRAQWEAEQREGVPSQYRMNYVPHFQDISKSVFDRVLSDTELVLGAAVGKGGSSTFRMQRKYHRYIDSIAAGVKPKTINALDALETRVKAGQRLINGRVLRDRLKTYKDPVSGMPLIGQVKTVGGVKTKSGRTKDGVRMAEPGYSRVDIAGIDTAVLKPYEALFRALNGSSWVQHNLPGRAVMKYIGGAKHLTLLIDTFHMGRLAYITSLGMHARPFKYREGLSLLEHNESTLRRMANRGEIKADALPDLLAKKKIVSKLIDNGLNTGRVADAMYADLVRNGWVARHTGVAQTIGRYNKWLFESYQRGIMTHVALMEYARLKKSMPELTESQLTRRVARDVNIRYGNLMKESWVSSATGQDLLRLAFLAPQWNEGLLRSEIGAVGQLGKMGLDAVTKRRIAAGSLARQAMWLTVTMFAGNQLLNQYTQGKYTWENDNPDHRWDAWLPDKIADSDGMYLSPLSLSAELSHQLSELATRRDTFGEALFTQLSYKMGFLPRAFSTWATQKDLLSGEAYVNDWELWGGVGKALTPIPIVAHAPIRAAVGAGEAFPGQYQKQLLATFGVKTSSARGMKRDQLSRKLYDKKYENLNIEERYQVHAELSADRDPPDSAVTTGAFGDRIARDAKRRQQGVYKELTPELQKAFGDFGVKLSGPEGYIELAGEFVSLTEDEEEKYIKYVAEEYNRILPNVFIENLKLLSYEDRQELVSALMTDAKSVARARMISEMGTK